MKKYAVIVAGGSGTRMGLSMPKQFLELRGKPVFIHTLRTFLDAFPGMEIILVFPEAYMDEGRHLLELHFPGNTFRLTTGGATRFESVQNGLHLVSEPSLVAVHDAVRCLVSVSIIRSCYEQALAMGSAIPAISVRDSLRRRVGDKSEVIDRAGVVQIQTPQTFRSDVLLSAMAQPYQPGFTDEATVVEAAGTSVHLIEGEETNIKLTLPADLIMAEMILDRRPA